MDAQELEFRYKEMVRLSNVLEQYSKSSFEDVKLLGSIGALLAFKPASSLLKIQDEQDGLFLIVGFLIILIIISLISFYGLLKQSLVVFYLDEISKFEKEFREGLIGGDVNIESFKVATNWKIAGSKKQREVAKMFYGTFYVVLVFFPTGVLYYSNVNDNGLTQALIYFVSAAVVSILHFRTAENIHKH